MRNISFALTTAQVRDGTKTVTRRLGWRNLKPGTILCACEKCQGIKKGGLVRIRKIVVVSVRREPLSQIHLHDRNETKREGFPGLNAEQFIAMFRKHMKCERETLVTRIKFSYLE